MREDREHVDPRANAALAELGDLLVAQIELLPVAEEVVRLLHVAEERPFPSAIPAPPGLLEPLTVDLLRLLVPVLARDVVREVELGPEHRRLDAVLVREPERMPEQCF